MSSRNHLAAVVTVFAIIAGACASAGGDAAALNAEPEPSPVQSTTTVPSATRTTEPTTETPDTEPPASTSTIPVPQGDRAVRLEATLTGTPPPFFLDYQPSDEPQAIATGFGRDLTITSEWRTTIAVTPETTSFTLGQESGDWIIEPASSDSETQILDPGASATWAIRVSMIGSQQPPEGGYTLSIPIEFWMDVEDGTQPNREPDGTATLLLTYTILPPGSVEVLSDFCGVAVSELADHYLLDVDEFLTRLDSIQEQADRLGAADRQAVTSAIDNLSNALWGFLAGERGFDSGELVETINDMCQSSLSYTATLLAHE